jgi:hypothetical protein
MIVPSNWIMDLSEKYNFFGGAKQYIERTLYCPVGYPNDMNIHQAFEIQPEFGDKEHCYQVKILRAFGMNF